MKKIFSVIMLVVFCMALAGCGESAEEKRKKAAIKENEEFIKTKTIDFSTK